jgi:hypothetical protein
MKLVKSLWPLIAGLVIGYLVAHFNNMTVVYSQTIQHSHVFNGKPHFQMKNVWCDYDKNGKLVNCVSENSAGLTEIVQEIVDVYSANCDNDDISGPDDPDK